MAKGIKQRNKKFLVRVSFIAANGKRKFIQRTAETKPEARKLRTELLNKLKSKGEEGIKAEKLLFRDLAERYSDLKIQPPKFRGDKQISGMRSHQMVKIYLSRLLDEFGGYKLADITPGRIQQFKEDRLSQKTKRGGEYSVAAVNRELQLLRAILNFAKQEGLIERTPFERSTKPIIQKEDEVRRNRVLSLEEESRLL
jgi:integrase